MKRLLIACIFILLLMGIILIATVLLSQPRHVSVEHLVLPIKDKPYAVEIAEAAEASIIEEVYEEPAYEYIYHYDYHDSDYDGMSAQDYIAQRESGQNYEAVNGQYYGKYQLQIDMLGGDLSPENQEETAQRYMEDRYGTWENAKGFWDKNGWW